LLGANADVNAKSTFGGTALIFASSAGHLGVVTALLSANADVNANGFTSLQDLLTKQAQAAVAARAGRRAIDRAMAGIVGPIVGDTPLMWASRFGHLDVVNALLVAKADVNAINDRDGTALMLAATYGQVEVVKTLLAANANVNATNAEGATALMKAASFGRPDVQLAVAKILLDAHADVHAKTRAGISALSLAVKNADDDMAALLRLYGARN
jgi:serine/threonine-protein phosphatase 6 regulatory ankyrin repeat subunit B